MPTALGQVVERALPGAARDTTIVSLPGFKEIPYDYVATFTLEGLSGNRLQQVVNISTEGAFVAVAIGYSFLPLRHPATLPAPVQPAGTRGRTLALARQQVAAAAVPAAAASVAGNTIPTLVQQLLGTPAAGVPGIPPAVLEELVGSLTVRLCGIDFLYSIIDSGSGRELQNLPIHNIAGLGKADGDRPFRPFARPSLFMPRSTIRIEITEQSQGDFYAGGTLYFVLHGYKILGYGTTSV